MTTIHERLVLDVALVHVSGRVTLTDGAALLGDTLQRLIQDDHSKIVVDLGEVPYLDSTGLGVLLRAHATSLRRGGALKLLRVHGHVYQLFEVTKLLTVFERFESDAEALASFAPPSSTGM